MAYDFQSLVVLPSIRLRRLHDAVGVITGDREMARAVMDAVEQHIEVNAYRWGNGCPKDGCYEQLLRRDSRYPTCPTHGLLGHMEPTELLIAFATALRQEAEAAGVTT